MANVNINAGAAGNPLDALLNGRSLYGDLGGLLVSQGAGYTTEGGDTVYGDGFIGPNDPRYMAAQKYLSDNGLTQLRNTNIGGPGQPIDPSKVTYDPRFGLVTNVGNVKQYGTDIGGWGPFALAAIPAIAIAAGALAGGGAAGGGTGAAGAFDGATAAAEGGTGAGAFGGATAGAEGSSGLLGGAFNGATAGAEGGTGVSGLLGQAGSWAMAHPLQAAGLAQTAYGLLGGGRSSAPSSGGSSKGGGGGSLGTQGIQQKFYVNPVTQAQLQRYQGGLL